MCGRILTKEYMGIFCTTLNFVYVKLLPNEKLFLLMVLVVGLLAMFRIQIPVVYALFSIQYQE